MSTRTIGVHRPKPLDAIDLGTEPSFSVIPRIALGFALGVSLLVGVGGWAATTDLNGAIMASGSVTVDQNAKAVQHRDGGIVGAILVRDGQAVTAGQVLIRIDDAQTRAELAIVKGQLVELSAKKARLLAERDGLRDIVFPAILSGGDGEMLAILDGESRLFRGNLASRDSQRQQLELQIGQVAEEIAGLLKQKDAKQDELAILTSEHGKLQGLVDKHLFESSKFLPISRDRHRLTGEQGSLEASIARAKVGVTSSFVRQTTISRT